MQVAASMNDKARLSGRTNAAMSAVQRGFLLPASHPVGHRAGNKAGLHLVATDCISARRRELLEESRWVVPPHGTVNLVVQFASDTIGRFSEAISLDVLCGEKNNKVTLMAACDYPRINTEPR